MTDNLAFIFPGQGEQYPTMGKDFYDSFKKAIELEPSFEGDLRDTLKELKRVKGQALDVDYSFSIR